MTIEKMTLFTATVKLFGPETSVAEIEQEVKI
jgi:hypothetical protein